MKIKCYFKLLNFTIVKLEKQVIIQELSRNRHDALTIHNTDALKQFFTNTNSFLFTRQRTITKLTMQVYYDSSRIIKSAYETKTIIYIHDSTVGNFGTKFTFKNYPLHPWKEEARRIFCTMKRQEGLP